MQLKPRHHGFTVIELLIALALGLLVVAGIIQLFVGNSRTYEIVHAQSRLQENARFAFEFVSRAARSAGYFGCAPEDANVARQLTGNWPVIPEYNMTEAVDGWESNGDGTFVPDDLTTLPRSEGGVNVNVHIDGTGIDRAELADAADILVFRAMERPATRLAATLQPTADPVVSTPGGAPAFAVNDVVLIADCEQASLFRVTGISTTADETTLQWSTAASAKPAYDNAANITTPLNDVIPATMSLLGRSYGREASVGRMEATFFFIAESTQADDRGNPVNALWRKVGNAAPVELVQGVEDMQLLYGVDSTADDVANVNQYQTIDNVADVNDIVAIQVTLTVSSVDPLTELNNQRMQRTFSKTVHVRNAG